MALALPVPAGALQLAVRDVSGLFPAPGESMGTVLRLLLFLVLAAIH